jgi:uncharacterized coiled-coil protein SlyX
MMHRDLTDLCAKLEKRITDLEAIIVAQYDLFKGLETSVQEGFDDMEVRMRGDAP